MPLFFTGLCFLKNKEEKFQKGFLFLLGLLLSLLYCLIDFFVGATYRTPVYTIASNYFFFFKQFIAIPFLVMIILFLLLGKDKIHYKLSGFSSMLFGFYTVFLPYSIMYKNPLCDYFLLFIVPAVFIAMLVYIDWADDFIIELIDKRVNKLSLLYIVPVLLFAVLIPSLIQALYYTDKLMVLCFILIGIFIAGAVALVVFNRLIQNTVKSKNQLVKGQLSAE